MVMFFFFGVDGREYVYQYVFDAVSAVVEES